MDELNIYLRCEDDNFEFKISDISNIETLGILSQGNPGAISIMLEIYKTYQEDEICVFINKIWKNQIIGARLWYIYKNECNQNINQLLSKDLTPFTKEYFRDKFEKYY